MNKYIHGQIYGRLTLILEVESSNKNNKVWLCRCSCGNYSNVPTNHLGNGHTKSCGCLQSESRTLHSMSKTRIYRIWQLMRDRCGVTGHDYHKYHQEMGIKVCDEWINAFAEFHKWSMENGYLHNLTIDRIDNNKNYCPSNCRWVSRAIQNQNTRRTIYIIVKGEKQLLSDFARFSGITYNTAYSRYKKGQYGKRVVI